MYKEPLRLHSVQDRMEWTGEVSAILIPETKQVTWHKLSKPEKEMLPAG